ncbi:MAG: hypothetical protein ACXQTI_07630 [Candidatus Nezhaarchaeales archaeon]
MIVYLNDRVPRLGREAKQGLIGDLTPTLRAELITGPQKTN